MYMLAPGRVPTAAAAAALRDLDLSYVCARLLATRLAREGLLPAPHVLLRLPYPWPHEWRAAYPLLRLPMLAPTGRIVAAYLHLHARLPAPPTPASNARDDFTIDLLRSGITLAQGPDRIRVLIRRDALALALAPSLVPARSQDTARPYSLPTLQCLPRLRPPSCLNPQPRPHPRRHYTLKPPSATADADDEGAQGDASQPHGADASFNSLDPLDPINLLDPIDLLDSINEREGDAQLFAALPRHCHRGATDARVHKATAAPIDSQAQGANKVLVQQSGFQSREGQQEEPLRRPLGLLPGALSIEPCADPAEPPAQLRSELMVPLGGLPPQRPAELRVGLVAQLAAELSEQSPGQHSVQHLAQSLVELPVAPAAAFSAALPVAASTEPRTLAAAQVQLPAELPEAAISTLVPACKPTLTPAKEATRDATDERIEALADKSLKQLTRQPVANPVRLRLQNPFSEPNSDSESAVSVVSSASFNPVAMQHMPDVSVQQSPQVPGQHAVQHGVDTETVASRHWSSGDPAQLPIAEVFELGFASTRGPRAASDDTASASKASDGEDSGLGSFTMPPSRTQETFTAIQERRLRYVGTGEHDESRGSRMDTMQGASITPCQLVCEASPPPAVGASREDSPQEQASPRDTTEVAEPRHPRSAPSKQMSAKQIPSQQVSPEPASSGQKTPGLSPRGTMSSSDVLYRPHVRVKTCLQRQNGPTGPSSSELDVPEAWAEFTGQDGSCSQHLSDTELIHVLSPGPERFGSEDPRVTERSCLASTPSPRIHVPRQRRRLALENYTDDDSETLSEKDESTDPSTHASASPGPMCGTEARFARNSTTRTTSSRPTVLLTDQKRSKSPEAERKKPLTERRSSFVRYPHASPPV